MTRAEPVEHRFNAPAGEICWFEWGKPGHGPSVLLLHATGFHARCWDRVVAALPQNMHVIAPDLRGHGRSFRPDALFNWGLIADDIAALIDAIGHGPFFVVGHSMGGFVGALLAARVPDSVCGLLLVDPVLLPPEWYLDRAALGGQDPADHPVSKRRNQWASAQEMFARFADRAPYASWVPEVLRDYCDYGLLQKADASFELACPPEIEASAYLGNAGCDIYPEIGAVSCPVTVLRAQTGERTSAMDFSISPTWPALSEQFRYGRDLQWADLTHFIPMEAPDRLAALIGEQLAGQQG